MRARLRLVLAGLALIGAPMSSASALACVDLRCEHLVEPLGVDRPQPRLSWSLTSARRGERQTAFQVIVGAARDGVAAGRGDAWDSGRVASEEPRAVYAGRALAPREALWWAVRGFDRDGVAGAWSAPTRFETGFFATAQWSARWIARTEDAAPLPAPLLRRAFASRGRPARARLYASGLAYAELSLNGARIGDAILDPGFTRFDRRALYVVRDVTDLVRDGDNVLGAMLGTGWLDVHTAAVWYFEKAPWRCSPRLLCELHLDYADGRHEVIASDGSWRTSTGAITYDSIYGGETYDARLEKPGWDAPGYDDRAWQPAVVVRAPGPLVSWQACPPIRVLETFPPRSAREVAPGVRLVDFGVNCASHLRLTIRGAKAGDAITIRYAERTGADGRIETGNIAQFVTKEQPEPRFQTETYVCKGGGVETHEGRFTYYGGDRCEISGWPGAFSLADVQVRLHATASERSGAFQCSDDLLERIYAATVTAYRANTQSIPTDCPQREKNGWTGDAHLAAEFGLSAFRSAAFYEKWLDDLSDEQRESGELPGIVPSSGWGYAWGNGPAWDSAYPLIAWYLYRYTGDATALARHYDRLKRYVEFLKTKAKDGLVPWGLGDWVPWKTETPVEVTSTAYWYVDALIVADAARILGKADDERAYRELAATIRADFLAGLMRADGGCANDSQTALSCALYQGLVDDARRPATFAKLLAAVEATGGHIDTGILGAKYVPLALHAGGRDDVAYRIATQRDQPGWGWWIAQGATSLWEDWRGTASLNHIMLGDISSWMVKALAGIEQAPDSVGFARLVIAPTAVDGLTWAKASQWTPRGPVSSAWRREGATFTLDIVVPPGATATVRLPLTASAEESGKPLGRAEGVTELAIDRAAQRRDVAIGAGSYRFVCR